MLSSESFAAHIQRLEATQAVALPDQVLLFGDQSYGSSIPFYLGRQVLLVDGRSSSMLFGSTFADAPRRLPYRERSRQKLGERPHQAPVCSA